MRPTDDLAISPAADGDEAAAIAAAIEALLAAEAAARAGRDLRAADGAWRGRRFAFAGRLEKVDGEAARVPDGAPADPWAAAGRVDRF